MGRTLLLCALAVLAPLACFSTLDEGFHGPQIKHVFLVRFGLSELVTTTPPMLLLESPGCRYLITVTALYK